MFVSPVTKQIFYLKPMVEDSFIKVDFIDPIFITGNLDEWRFPCLCNYKALIILFQFDEWHYSEKRLIG